MGRSATKVLVCGTGYYSGISRMSMSVVHSPEWPVHGPDFCRRRNPETKEPLWSRYHGGSLGSLSPGSPGPPGSLSLRRYYYIVRDVAIHNVPKRRALQLARDCVSLLPAWTPLLPCLCSHASFAPGIPSSFLSRFLGYFALLYSTFSVSN